MDGTPTPPPTTPDPAPPPTTPDPPPPPGTPASAVPTATPFGPAEAGKRSPDPIGVVVLDEDGQPVAGAAYQWEADENAGWVYPPGGLTDADGGISATWVAGSPGDGVLTLSVGEGTSVLTTELETSSAPHSSTRAARSTWWRTTATQPLAIPSI